MATVTLFRLLVFGAAALLTTKVYVVETPFAAVLGLRLAVYTTMTGMAALVLAVIPGLVSSLAVSVVAAG
jgi:hypothetical protein